MLVLGEDRLPNPSGTGMVSRPCGHARSCRSWLNLPVSIGRSDGRNHFHECGDDVDTEQDSACGKCRECRAKTNCFLFRRHDPGDFELVAGNEFLETRLTSKPVNETAGSADDAIDAGRHRVDSDMPKSRLTVDSREIMGARQPVAKKRRKVLLQFFVIDQRLLWLMAAAEIHDTERASQRDVGRQPVAHYAEVCQP